ncbi:MAG: hypothetical protein KDC44_14790 [Phaeodactylibacter sp.]|nr:hypothetical protein [Phaeodactylibacter sp.]
MSSVKLTYYGKVDPTGKIGIPKRSRAEIASEFVGQTVEVVVRKKRSYRTLAANAYYWGVLIRYTTKAMREQMPDVLITDDLVHQFLKDKFLPLVVEKPTIPDPETGELIELAYTTTILLKSEFADYCTLIEKWGVEILNILYPARQQEFDGCDIDQKLVENEL